MASIAVTGASGELGGATVRFLLQRKVAPNSIVAVVRDAGTVTDFAAQGVQVRRGDYTDPTSLEGAFRGADTLLFVSTSVLGEERMRHHRNVVNAVRAAAVKHIVYTSVIKPATDAKFAASPEHFHTEALIRESRIPYTFFRNNLYLDIIAVMFGEALQTGSLVHNGGNGRVGFIAREDIAYALAVVLTTGEHANREYPITAATPYSLSDEASASAGERQERGLQAGLERRVPQALDERRLPAPVVAMPVSLGDAIRAGEFDTGSNELERLMGRAPVALEPFLQEALAPK